MGYPGDADTANMKQYFKQNSGFAHFLVLIDCFSKKAYTKALKTLTGREMVLALKDIFQHSIKFERIRSDQGKEMMNRPVQDYLKSENIKHFVTHNTEIKANIAERCLKSLKSKLTRYMTANNTHRWFDQLANITESYNNTYHRTIKTTPASVTKQDEIELWKLQYEQYPKTKPKSEHPPKPRNPFQFKIHDTVRISALKSPFQREYDEKWSREYYLVSDRFINQTLDQYKLKDIQNEELMGTYYRQELQKVYIQPDATYIINKILKTKGKGDNKMVLVSWLGWHHRKYQTWLRQSEVINYSHSENSDQK